MLTTARATYAMTDADGRFPSDAVAPGRSQLDVAAGAHCLTTTRTVERARVGLDLGDIKIPRVSRSRQWLDRQAPRPRARHTPAPGAIGHDRGRGSSFPISSACGQDGEACAQVDRRDPGQG